LQITEYPWFLGFGIQLGTPLFLGTDIFWFQLSTEVYTGKFHGLLLYTWSLAVMTYLSTILIHFQWYIACSLTCALQKKSAIDVYTGRVTLPQMWHARNTCEVLVSNKFLIGSTAAYDSAMFQWEIAWPRFKMAPVNDSSLQNFGSYSLIADFVIGILN
jgi:hypothetical protein